jgi:nicotinate-nucleotide adenylyltransferase
VLVPVPGRRRRAGARLSRVGILGGTFNPPHLGHLLCAQEAWAQLELDEVLLMPVAAPPHKAIESDPGAGHRLAMCEAAVAADGRLRVSRLDLERPPPSFTADTLRLLHERAPGDELTFIVGGDMALSLPAWHEPDRVLERACLAVAEREGVKRRHIVEHLAAALPASVEHLAFFDMPRFDVSSSEVRRRVRAGLPIRYLVPDPVATYVAEHGLYRLPAAVAPAADTEPDSMEEPIA